MKITPEILKIQERADKTLSFGCIIRNGTADNPGDEWAQYITTNFALQTVVVYNGHYEHDYENYGHPMNRGRLCYLYQSDNGEGYEAGEAMRDYAMFQHREVLQQTVLERSPDFQKLVIAFLESLPDNITTTCQRNKGE